MATYEYRCRRHGVFGVTFPIGAATTAVRCAGCGSEAVRVFSAPLLARTPAPLRRAMDRAERSAEAPEVVSALPGRRRPARPVDPRHARLPRP